MTYFWGCLAALVWASRMIGVPFLHCKELLQHPAYFTLTIYLVGVVGLLTLVLLVQIFHPRTGQLPSVFALLAYYLILPDYMGLLVARPQLEYGRFLMLLAFWLVLRRSLLSCAGALAILCWILKVGWFSAAGLLSITLAGGTFLVIRGLTRSRWWGAAPALLRVSMVCILGYVLFQDGELALNRRLIVPFQRKTHSFPLRGTAPSLIWLVSNDCELTGLLPEDAGAIAWLAGHKPASAVLYSPMEAFESEQTFRIYSELCPNLTWCGWHHRQPNWGLNWIRQGGDWKGCGVELVIVRGAASAVPPEYHQGGVSVYRNPSVSIQARPARGLLLHSSLEPGGQATWEVVADGPVVASEPGQLPNLVLPVGRQSFRLPWECSDSRLEISGGLALTLPGLSFSSAWRGLRLLDLEKERRMGSNSVELLSFQVRNEGLVAVDLRGMQGVQLTANFAGQQPVYPLTGVIRSGETKMIEIPWNSPAGPVYGRLNFCWVDPQGRLLDGGSFPIRVWDRIPPALSL